MVGPPQLLGKTVPGGSLGTDQVLLTRVQRRGDYFRQALAVPARRFYVTVSATRLATVNRVIGSAQAMPSDSTAMPNLWGANWEAAVQALTATRLEVRRLPSSSRGPAPHRIWSERPAPGSIVPVGTQVRLRFD
jgi:hypothetical protein